MASAGAREDCPCTTSLRLSGPRNHTPIPCPLPEPGSPPQDSRHLARLPQAPLLGMSTPSQATASTRGQHAGDTHLGTAEFLNE